MSLQPSALQVAKHWLVENVGLVKDALHVYVALTLFFGSAALFKWPVRSWKPFAVVLAVALVGEAWDLRDSIVYREYYRTEIDLWANLHDIWNTCFWPLVIVLLARRTEVFTR